jgi:hypothetical protein
MERKKRAKIEKEYLAASRLSSSSRRANSAAFALSWDSWSLACEVRWTWAGFMWLDDEESDMRGGRLLMTPVLCQDVVLRPKRESRRLTGLTPMALEAPPAVSWDEMVIRRPHWPVGVPRSLAPSSSCWSRLLLFALALRLFLGWRLVMPPRMTLIFSTSWMPSAGLGFYHHRGQYVVGSRDRAGGHSPWA